MPQHRTSQAEGMSLCGVLVRKSVQGWVSELPLPLRRSVTVSCQDGHEIVAHVVMTPYLVMTNIANWKDPPFLRTANHLFLWAISHGYVFYYQRVSVQPPSKKSKNPSRIQCAMLRGFLKVFTRFEKWTLLWMNRRELIFLRRSMVVFGGLGMGYRRRCLLAMSMSTRRIKIKPFNMAFWYPKTIPGLRPLNSSKLSLYIHPQPLHNCNTYSNQYALRLVNLLI